MANRVVIVDYGIGNLFSVLRAVEVSGCDDVCVSSNPNDIANAERIILPGVGAFADGMNGLRECGLVDPLLEAAGSGKHILGICLGMQLLATNSEEFGIHLGLGLIPGDVVAIPNRSIKDEPMKTPYIGWVSLQYRPRTQSDDIIPLQDLGKSAVYLVHSYHVTPYSQEHLLAVYDNGGHEITAAIKKGNVTGVQFHPEKSGPAGIEIIRNFIR